ncbi:hypothetical protein LJR153_004462 [Paenibacillus sp. LjRoot153]|uniref:hypothetical protein n=1 Tax=unclassified Paenibacillus TaxID=185978 RepID=UPI00070BD821|nr:hypothetical protein [Paenibacillus sp. Soil766]KRE98285.1 hypothetical protein ASG89_04530 [Paenibacillus sp. Soil766]
MAYDPQVVDATIVSDNKKNGLFEVVVSLKDRNKCRLFFERDAETGIGRVTDLNRLMKEPCPICRKDYLCNCLDRYKHSIADQALTFIK